MKKILLSAIIFTFAISFSSCGKDECECNNNGATLIFDENDMKDAGMDDFGKYCSTLDGLAKLNSPNDACVVK